MEAPVGAGAKWKTEKKRRCKTSVPTIVMGNVRSLANQMDELCVLTKSQWEYRECSVMCFSETWLHWHIPDNSMALPGFSSVRVDRDAILSFCLASGVIDDGSCNQVSTEAHGPLRLVCQMTVVQTYCGKASGSEPEASAVMNLVGQMVDQTLCLLTIHSAGQLILLPYGHPQISAPNYDELVSVGEAAAAEMNKLHGMGYTVGTSPQILYPNSGSSLDWARLIGIPFSYTFELRDKGEFSHLLPEDQIQPACQEAYAGVLSIITYVHDKAFNSGAVPNAAVSGVALVMLSSIMVVFLLVVINHTRFYRKLVQAFTQILLMWLIKLIVKQQK